MAKVEVDFAYEGQYDEADVVEVWRQQFAPRVTATIVGNANGWPVVALEGDADAVQDAVRVGGWDA